MKERKVPSWHDYFFEIANKVKERSKDLSTQVGCVIASKENTPISWGYNGFVAGCDEDLMSWERPLKYELVIHAEMNAILFSDQSLKGAKCYVTHAPCSNCLKHLLQVGVREIYYLDSDLSQKFSEESREAIKRLIIASKATVMNPLSGLSYSDDLELKKINKVV